MSNRNAKKQKSDKWAGRIFWVAVLPLFGAAIALPLVRLKASQKMRCEAADRLARATDQLLDRIGVDSDKTPESLSPPMDASREFEQKLKDWLNSKDTIKQANLRCISVRLNSTSADTYHGFATFDDSEQVRVEVGREKDSGELYFRADRPALTTILFGTLPGYECTTIGRAFDSFFADPNWITRTSHNGYKLVEFTGHLKRDLFQNRLDQLLGGYETKWRQGDRVRILFSFSNDGESYGLWSVQRHEDQPIRANDWEQQTILNWLFEEIYEPK